MRCHTIEAVAPRPLMFQESSYRGSMAGTVTTSPTMFWRRSSFAVAVLALGFLSLLLDPAWHGNRAVGPAAPVGCS